jgi:tryptophanyl-tRNA synthetase
MTTAQSPKIALSGIKSTSGLPHLGNILGMILPAIELQKTGLTTFYFVANFHSLTTVQNADQLRQDTRRMAAAFLALGYDATKGSLYLQSDVPEVVELMWLLSSAVSMGDLFRAHAYKVVKDKGEEGTLNLATFAYPVLMAADILAYDADIVPVGKDQVQHLEMSRAIAKRFNHFFGAKGDVFKEPKELVQEDVGVVPGIDGRKMSKSYGNGIDPFLSSKLLKKQVMAIVTDSKGLEDIKDPTSCNILQLYKLFSNAHEMAIMEENYRKGGYGYGHAKMALFEKIETRFAPARNRFNELMENSSHLDDVLKEGALKARAKASQVLRRARLACGID